MKFLGAGVLLGLTALAVGGSSVSARATTYEFTYDFVDSGQYNPNGAELGATGVISGFFTGSGPINDINVSSVISVSLNGTPLTGPFAAYHYVPGPGTPPQDGSSFVSGGAVVSGDLSLSNFLFKSTATSADFYVIQPWDNPPGQTLAAQLIDDSGKYADYYNGQFVASNFSVSAVPELSTWAMMMLGFAGLGFVGYRASRKTVAVGI